MPNMPAISEWQPSTLMEDIVYMWHKQLPDQTEIAFISAITRLQTMSPISRWSLCAGSGIADRFFAVLSKVWISLYNIDVQFVTTVMSERDPVKRRFLDHQHDPTFLVGDNAELGKHEAANLAHGGSVELLPACVGLDAGFPCVSRSPQNCNSKRNINCVQKGIEKTGEGWQHCYKAVKQHLPTWCVFECVKELGHKADDSDTSDSEFIINELQQLGYWVRSDVLDAEHYGSFAPRLRMYWAAIRIPLVDELQNQRAHVFFTQIMNAFKVQALPVDRFVTHDDTHRSTVALRSGFQLWSSIGERSSKRPQDDMDWKMDHKRHFEAMGLAWPPFLDHHQYSDFAGLLPREKELVAFYNKVWPRSYEHPPSYCEFIDIHKSLKRVGSGVMTIDEDGRGTLKKASPWQRGRPPTLTGSTKVIVRYGRPDDCHVRVLEPFEYFRMQGWGDAEWRRILTDDTDSIDFFELCSNMAGNSYSMFHFGPWVLALLATWACFGLGDGAPQDTGPAGGDVSRGSDGEHSDGSCSS